MASSKNSRQSTLKMSLAFKVWLIIFCVGLSLITFAPLAGASGIRESRTYESVLRSYGRASPKELITGNSANEFLKEGDVESTSAEGSKETIPADLGESCDFQVNLQSTQTYDFMPDGLPTFTVTFTNTCLSCSFSNIHITCGEFESPTSLDPTIFRKVGDNDCLLLSGGFLAPQGTVTFEYESTFQYPMFPGKADSSC